MEQIKGVILDGVEYNLAGGGAEVSIDEDTLVINNNGSGGGGSSAKHIYSTDEHIVGEWIDGKPIYEQTIYVSNPVLGAWTSIMHNASADVTIDVKVIINSGEYNACSTVHGLSSGVGDSSGVIVNGFLNSINYYIGRDYNPIHYCYFTIQYTKTTD